MWIQSDDMIKISGQDAVEFANSYYRPTKEEIKHFQRYMNDIDERIKIKGNTIGGFEATIEDLDLSFLDEMLIKNNIRVEIPYNVKKQETLYIDNNRSTTEMFIETVETENYSKTENNDVQYFAA